MRALRRVRVKDGRNQAGRFIRVCRESPVWKSFREQVSAWWGDQLDK